MIAHTPSAPVRIIAEIGVNHNGSAAMARQLIDAARRCGADAVKLQLFRAAQLAAPDTPLADYQQQAAGAGARSQYELLRQLELSEAEVRELGVYCEAQQIELLATPFDRDALRLLVHDLRASSIKLGSGELTNLPFLLEVGRCRRQLLLSTGMATLAEVEQALSVLAYGLAVEPSDPLAAPPSLAAFRQAYVSAAGQAALQRYVTVLHATTAYPAPPASCNLRAMDTLRAAFRLPTGLSDHSEGSAVAIAAVARGACVIEKHLTLDRSLPGVDHQASMEPEDFGRMVRDIRQIEMALGSPAKLPDEAELRTSGLVRRSIVAATDIAVGEQFSERNLTFKRPAGGLPPERYWELLGRASDHSYRKDEPIQ
ncbi:N-acetylneuraminate synthase [Paenibacillus sp. 598K]|uniref:N-acetylneuraminate synthase n=1 Tax=Paenibacillus sp. 598K TaxID=1117987 RepID=UPI000FFA44E4|nr:N-acetylneuraminate synthase [Paenibacillus sp. 598K]GBF75155.1 N-acetylneuraminate synthase [Paenibacillus sp. 598K]